MLERGDALLNGQQALKTVHLDMFHTWMATRHSPQDSVHSMIVTGPSCLVFGMLAWPSLIYGGLHEFMQGTEYLCTPLTIAIVAGNP